MMSKVFDYYNEREEMGIETKMETRLCDGDCGGVYYYRHLHSTGEDNYYLCKKCMFIFTARQDEEYQG